MISDELLSVLVTLLAGGVVTFWLFIAISYLEKWGEVAESDQS